MLVLLVEHNASIANNLFVNKQYLQKFANNLKLLRKKYNLTQDDLASEDISRSMVSLIELAKTDFTATKAKAIADAMNIHVKELFDFD